jgi:tRNA U34 5-carboxymethylaminomethyl modifying GTPase MnmE/TrmE
LRGSLLTPYVDIAIVISMPLNTDNLATKLEFVNRVARFASTGPVVYKYSALLALQGDTRQAIDILNRAVIAYPEYLEYIVPYLDQIRGMDKLKIAPYLERVQQHVERQQKLAREGDALRATPPLRSMP